MKKLNVGIIGCGSIARLRHIPEYAVNPNVGNITFCDYKIERAEKFASSYGSRAYVTHKELLLHEKPDIVSICTPLASHANIAVDSANSGAHVLCEKPIASSEVDAIAMIEAAKRNNVLLMIGHNQRFFPWHIKAKEIIKEGRLGKPLSFRSMFSHSGPEHWSADGINSWFFDKSQAMAGVVADLGIHKVDIIRWLLEDDVAEVGATMQTLCKTNTELDDNAVIMLRMKNGAIGVVEVSWTFPNGEKNTTEIIFERGIMKIDDYLTENVIVEFSNGTIEKYSFKQQTIGKRVQINSMVIDNFVNSVLNQTKPLISGEEGLKALEIILAAISSNEEKKLSLFK
ncbi:Gfo/Idh/MocA family protein [Paenibacillus tundrae]|uniref:Gfo/Idh/MocA family protein n=1 Tax=Paenibacillus tundrae TaxID=528187 RepID=UPI0022A9E919|nr:Gfo/Idh/MocA family oxidoreductase [Paenibacillus tundrae]MCZ1264755.1 gfo/Idh/MocA family oxidoreductase [Paenibacillus tundrae]